MTVVRRVERPAEESGHGTNSNDSSPTSTAVPFLAPASRRARSSSASPGGVPTTRKPSSVRSRLQRARLRLRPVHEELGRLVDVGRHAARGSGTSVKSALRSSSTPAPVAHEIRKTATMRGSEIAELRLGLEVDLVEHDDLRELVEAGAVGRQLAVDQVPLLVGRMRGVDHVQDAPRPLQVGQELVPEPDALARTLDQPGHVRDDELPPVRRLHRAEHGGERREGILGDLRRRVREPAEERRLARVREACERGVGEQLQVELEIAFLARHPDLGEARDLPRRAHEPGVAAPAAPAAREHDGGAGAHEVRDEVVPVENLRPDRHVHDLVLAVRAVLAGASAGRRRSAR